jgi:hypothetical protein
MAEDARIKLPERSTRGKRMRAQIEDEEAEADADFWNQEFFAEDAGDADYASEKEEEDVPDSDFFESESEESDAEVEVRERKKKSLKPPGAPPGGPRPRPPKPPQPKTPQTPASNSPSAAAAASDELPQSVIFEAMYEAPSLRKSTRARVEEAQKEREQREQQAKTTRRPNRQTEYRVLTQEELLAEAARTELDNLASLKQMLAQEEETKRKANIKKQRFAGPLIRFRSRTVQVLVPPEVAAREKQWHQQQSQQQQQQQQAAAAPAAGTATATAASSDAAAVKQEPTAAAAAADPAAAAAGADPSTDAGKASEQATPMQVDQPQQQQQDQPQQQQQPEQPQGPVLQCQARDTLQCLGMKAPKWLLPQRAPGAAAKPICPITGTAARYRDPLTGHYYSSVEAFRELRRRVGQPLPPYQPYRRLAASPAAELQALLGAPPAAAAAGDDAEAADPAAAATDPAAAAAAGQAAAPAGAAGATQAAAGAGGLPAGQLQLQELVQRHVQQQLAAAGAKGRSKSQAYHQQPQQQQAPDEVAALVLQVGQMVHG